MSQAVGHIFGARVEGVITAHQGVSDQLEKTLRLHCRTIKPGRPIIIEGDRANTVLCVLSGWLSLSKSLPDGESQIVDLALQGEIIETGGPVSSVTVEAVSQASVALVPVATWAAIKLQRPDLDQISKAIRAASRSRMAERMLRLGRGRAAMRMAYALLELNVRLEALGQAREGKYYIPMNQRILGDFVGLSSVHVCRTLGRLVSDGIIKVAGQMDIEILDFDALSEIAGIELISLQREIILQGDDMTTAQPYAAFA
jgi:CRP-like cAMP-binding protein